ncbi:MAG: glycosyltransferase [Candidatus Sulfotelmatobacter sp.]
MHPLLSVVMPVYNGERFIAAALESVRGQHEGIELVIVDDGSSDRTLDIVRDFAKVLPIRLLTPRRIGNWVAVSNIGLREATGDWACFLHQDDLWLPGRIERLRGEMESAEDALVLHNAIFVGPAGRELGPWTCPLPEGDVPQERFIERLLIQNFIAIPSPVFRRNAAIGSGGLDEGLWFSADWDLWLRLGALGPVRFIAETLSAFRVHPASQTAARKVLPEEWETQLTTVLARHLQNLPVTGNLRAKVERAGMASIAVNSALLAASRGEPVSPSQVFLKLLALGPSGWHRYVRDSRIVQRVRSRLKAQRS